MVSVLVCLSVGTLKPRSCLSDGHPLSWVCLSFPSFPALHFSPPLPVHFHLCLHPSVSASSGVSLCSHLPCLPVSGVLSSAPAVGEWGSPNPSPTSGQHLGTLAETVVVVCVAGAEVGALQDQAALAPRRATVPAQRKPGSHPEVVAGEEPRVRLGLVEDGAPIWVFWGSPSLGCLGHLPSWMGLLPAASQGLSTHCVSGPPHLAEPESYTGVSRTMITITVRTMIKIFKNIYHVPGSVQITLHGLTHLI